ncbi:toxin-antitoxin system YwqK family antitoxin [Fusobacterium polymorphum]|nr:toxin-antitoxin system YwqK family antitoxin [uncultured Fusobacterium sp.]
MRRKNFILTIILFLFISILGFSNEKLPNVNTSLNSMNPTYDKSLKEYKIKSENTDSFYNYIKKMISEKSTATVYTKLENGNLIATDENNNIIFIEKLPENISEKTTYFESKQIYQVKNGKMLVNTDYVLDSDGEKTRIISETLLKKSINGKNIFGIIDLMGDLSISLEKTFANVETYKSDIYDENDELIFSATYKNKKIEAESEVDGTFMKMTYVFEDNNFNKGTINIYIDKKLLATVKVKDSLQDGEMKIFYPNGKVMGTSIFKNGKLNGVSKMYYENGKIMTKMNFKDDELEGEAIIYDEDGKILDKQFYKNGEEVIK